MGKTSTAEMKKKKKGRPSLSDPKKPFPKQLFQQQQQTLISSNPNFNTPNNRRSTRRNPSLNGISPESDVDGGDEDDDDERKEKKVKLVVRLPPFNQPRSNSGSYGSDSNADDEKPQISASGDRSVADQVEMVQKATDTIQGFVLESGPTTTPLPDKKFLMFILDRLQKKDIYGVFSEPVDPNELPDYLEIIEHPMDFGTVRKKLDEGRYPNLDEFEADVFLICSNAMQYNAPDTVYFRQARSIQELAKRDFENLRQVNDDGEPQPKIVRRGRPPGKNAKKSLGGLPLERVGPESASDATLATGGDNATGSNSYNLRREPAMSSRFRPNDALFRASHLSHNNDTYTDWSTEWNNEFPASILKAEAKHVKKQFSLDENRRATYKQFHPSVSGHEPSPSTALSGEIKQLMGVGLQFEHGYARSLARFAANLGPVAWKVASKKIERVLPSGVKFGPGWVGENEAAPPPPSLLPEQKSSNNSVLNGRPLERVTSSVSGVKSIATSGSSLPCKEVTLEAASRQNSGTDSAVLKSGVRGTAPGPTFQTLQKNLLHSDRNGFNGVSGYDLSSQTSTGRMRLSMPTGLSGLEVASVSRNNSTLTSPMVANHIISEPKLSGRSRSTSTHCENVSAPCTAPPDANTEPEMVALSGVHPWPGVPLQQHRQYSLSVPPDLNVRFQAPGSPSSSFRTGSPQQPDLALQL